MTRGLLLVIAAALAIPAAARAAPAAYDESRLLAIVGDDALAANVPANTPFANRVRWTENRRDIASGTGRDWSADRPREIQ